MEKTGQNPEGLLQFMEKFRYEELMSVRAAIPISARTRFPATVSAAMRKRVEQIAVNSKPQDARSLEQLAMMKAKLVGFIGPPARVLSRYPASDQSIPGKYARTIAAYRAVDIKAAMTGIDDLIALKPDDPYF